MGENDFSIDLQVGMASTENVDDLSYSTAAVGFAFGELHDLLPVA